MPGPRKESCFRRGQCCIGDHLSQWDNPENKTNSGSGRASFTCVSVRLRPMFHLHSSLRYYLYPLPVDMRKSFYTLSGVVNSLMNQDVRDGGVFIFMNRHMNVMKILHMEYAGLVIYHKRLESGRFKLPIFDETTASISIEWKDLMSMVESVRPGRLKTRRIVNNYQSFS